jgi:hypothetical protein
VAVSALPFMWLDLLGRPVPEDDAAADWDVRFDRCVGQRRRGRLRGGKIPKSPEGRMIEVWAGADTGKAHHHCVVIDSQGRAAVTVAAGR